jgi:hypothetical protein
MEKIRKILGDKTYEWNPDAYGKGGWFVVNNSGKLSPAKKEISEQLGRPAESQIKKKDITKKIGNEIYIWKPEALGGKGAWYVLGSKGGLVRLAGTKESKKLGIPKQESVKPVSVPEITIPKVEQPQRDDGRGLSDRNKEYRKQDVDVSNAKIIKNTGLGRLIAQNLTNGENLGSAIKSAISDKAKSKSTLLKNKFNIKKNFDPLNIGKMIGGDLGVSLVGKLSKRSVEDQEYFMKFPGIARRKRTFLDTKIQYKNKKTKNTDPLHTKISTSKRININKGDSISDVLTKLYNLQLKIDEETKKRMELENDFKKQRELDQEKLLNEVLEKVSSKKSYKKINIKSEEMTKDSAFGLFSFLENLKLIDFLKNVAKKSGSLLVRLGAFLVSPVGLALVGLTTFAALTVWLSGLLTDKVKTSIPNYRQISNEEARNVLSNGKDHDIIETAKQVVGRDENGKPIEVKNVEEAKEILTNYIKNSPKQAKVLLDKKSKSEDNIKKIEGDLKDLRSGGVKVNKDLISKKSKELESVKSELDKIIGDINKTASMDILEKNASEAIDMGNQDSVERRYNLNNSNTTSDVSVPNKGSDISDKSTELQNILQKISSSTNISLNSPTNNVINGGGGDVLFEQLTGVRTEDPTLKKILMCNYRPV